MHEQTSWAPGAPRAGAWNRRSPMWWHRSPGHRLAVIFGAIVGVAAGYFLYWGMLLAVVMVATAASSVAP